MKVTSHAPRFETHPAQTQSQTPVQDDPAATHHISRRVLPHTSPTQIQEQAAQLVERSDGEMAEQFSAALMSQIIYKRNVRRTETEAPTVTNIPPFSTFGQAWARFTQALNQEPFATFAKDNNIDRSNLRWFPDSGGMECTINGQTKTFLNQTPGWTQAASVVAAAARDLVADQTRSFQYTGGHEAPIALVGDYYAVERDDYEDDPFKVVKSLQDSGEFDSLIIPNGPLPLDTPSQTLRIRQAQRTAKETIATATFERSGGIADSSRTPTPSERVDEADRELARICSRVLTAFSSSSQWRLTNIPDIPADSSYIHAIEKYRETLSTDTFLRFTREHNIIPSTVVIDVPSGDLQCFVTDPSGKPKSAKFTKTSSEHWAAIERNITNAARNLAPGGSYSVETPDQILRKPDIYQILNFYGAKRENGSQQQWMAQNAGLIRAGFPALVKHNPAMDDVSRAVRNMQQAAVQAVTIAEHANTRRHRIDAPSAKAAPQTPETAKPAAVGPVSAIARSLFEGEPGLQTVVAGLLKDTLSQLSPSLKVDVEQLAFAEPDPTNPGQFNQTQLMELAIDCIAGNDAPVFASEGKFVDTRANALALTGTPAGTALAIDKPALQRAMSELSGKLNVALQKAQLDYWGKPPFSAPAPGFGADTSVSVTPMFAGDRRLMLSDLVRSNLRLASLKHPGLNDLQRETLDMAVRYPHGSTRPKLADGSQITVYAIASTERAHPDNPDYLTPNLIIERKLAGHPVVLVCEPSGKVTPYTSLAAAKQAWEQNLKTQLPGDTFSTSLTKLEADAFYIQASVVINRRVADAVNTEPTLLNPQQPDQSQQKPSEWMRTTSDANRFILHDLTLELADYMRRNKEHTYNSDIPDIRTYTQNQLNALSPPPVPYDINDVEVLFHTPYGGTGAGFGFGAIRTTKMALSDAFIQNLAGLPGGSIEVRHKPTGTLIPALGKEGALKALIEKVNVGKNYPDLLKRELLDDPAKKAERQLRFVQQVPIELKMKALELTAKGASGFDNAMGFRYLQAVLDPTPGTKSVNGNEITMRPLAFVPEPGASPDIVENMYLIEPKDSSVGPHVLYRPLMADAPLMQFPSRKALMEAIQKPGKLQNDILAWMPDETTRTVYAHGGFSEPHLHRNRVFIDDFTIPSTPAAPTLATTGAGIDDIGAKLQAGQLMSHLYEANAKTVTTLAERQTVSNAESRWATLKEGGFLVLNAVLPALRGPGALIGLALQTQGILGDIEILTNEKGGNKEAALIDLLTNLASLVLHASVRTSNKTPAAPSTVKPAPGTLLPGDVPSRPLTNTLVTLGGRVENIKAIDGDIQYFEDIYNGEKRINIIGHGYKPKPGAGTRILGEGKKLSGDDVYYELLARGVDFKQYKEGRILTCYSAAGGDNSLAAQLHRATNLPFKGFEGTVIGKAGGLTELPDQVFKTSRAGFEQEFPHLSHADIDKLAGIQMKFRFIQNYVTIKAVKPHGSTAYVNIGTAEKPVIVPVTVNYQPARFGSPKVKLSPDAPNFIPTRQPSQPRDFSSYENFKTMSHTEQKANSILLSSSEGEQFEFFIDGQGSNPKNRLNILGHTDKAGNFEGNLREDTPQTPESLAALIAPLRTKTNADTLRLISDKAAQSDLPQKLANATGLQVEAPMGYVPVFQVTEDRYWLLAQKQTKNNPDANTWKTFTPES